MASDRRRDVWGHRIVTWNRLANGADAEHQGEDRTDTLGGLAIGAFEFDAVGAYCYAPFPVLQ